MWLNYIRLLLLQTSCSCFSQISLLVLVYMLHFSAFLLFEYVKLDNSFCYQVLVENCKFLEASFWWNEKHFVIERL